MQIHRIRGRDLRDALQRAGLQYGANAVVLSHETMPDGAVTVAVADPGRQEAVKLLGAIKPPRRDPGLDDVERVMQRSGASREWIDTTLAGIAQIGARGPFALDAAAELLGSKVKVAPSPRVSQRDSTNRFAPCVISFVGPTGVGKTTTLAKLASRLVRSGRRVGVISMDTHRPGAVEQLRALAEAMQVPVEVARDGDELAAGVASHVGADCVLVDTTGRSPRDAAALEALAAPAQGAAATLETYLVLPATSSRAALEEAHRGFDAARPTAWVVTKLDETREPATILESAADHGAAVAFLCDGQEISAHFHRAHAERFADLFLRGRIG
jgi:flagellar biosynthesis GTPase FlhF